MICHIRMKLLLVRRCRSFPRLLPAQSSPYSASKASSDHLVRAWHRTYGLPILVTNCSNNSEPWQHAEKLISQTIAHALAGKPIPLYGKGDQIRDWLYVEDHARALYKVVTTGVIGETYNIGGRIWMWSTPSAICSTRWSPRLVLTAIKLPMWRIAPVTIAVMPSMLARWPLN